MEDYEIEEKNRVVFERPNYTQVPNLLFDELMKEMGEAELRVTLCLVRKIVGYHKIRPEAVSLSQIQRMTGLSRVSAVNGLEQAMERGLIKRAGNGKRGVSLFQLVHPDDDQLTTFTRTSKASIPVTSKASLLTKEKKKKESKEKNSPLTPQGDSALETMIAAVKKHLRQSDKKQAENVARTLLAQHPEKKAAFNLVVPITVEDLPLFCIHWDKKKDRDGNSLTRPRNTTSVLNAVTDWQSTLQQKSANAAKPEPTYYQVPDMLSEAEHRAEDAAREGEKS